MDKNAETLANRNELNFAVVRPGWPTTFHLMLKDLANSPETLVPGAAEWLREVLWENIKLTTKQKSRTVWNGKVADMTTDVEDQQTVSARRRATWSWLHSHCSLVKLSSTCWESVSDKDNGTLFVCKLNYYLASYQARDFRTESYMLILHLVIKIRGKSIQNCAPYSALWLAHVCCLFRVRIRGLVRWLGIKKCWSRSQSECAF